MTILYLVLYILAAVLFVLTAFGAVVQRINLMALGLFCWVLVPLIQTLQRL